MNQKKNPNNHVKDYIVKKNVKIALILKEQFIFSENGLEKQVTKSVESGKENQYISNITLLWGSESQNIENM